MAKTRRHKINRRPSTVFGSQSAPRVVEQGSRFTTSGVREKLIDSKPAPSKTAKPVFVTRVYTGLNKGKTYPYASAKRGGTPAAQ